MKAMKKDNKFLKIKLLFWPLIYLVAIIIMSISYINIFNQYYYTSIFVQGPSMQPTLNVNYPSINRRDFGLVDKSQRAINNLKRFDIVITYFPWSTTDYEYSNGSSYQTGDKVKDNAEYKIKRLIALPGETVEIKADKSVLITTKDGEQMLFDKDLDSTVENENYRFPFNRKTVSGGSIASRVGTWTLDENRYFLMGDNWDVSEDCSKHVPVYVENLVGRLVCIEGTCLVKRVVDSKDPSKYKDVIYDKHYGIPIPF